MRHLHLLVCLLLVVSSARGAQSPAPEALRDPELLYEVVRHLYRWHLDERDAEKIVNKSQIPFWVREATPALDPGDKSRFGEIVIPDWDVEVRVKRADYTIPELDVKVQNDRFKIINVSRGDLPTTPDGYDVVHTSYVAMREYGHRTRMLARFPEGDLLMRMRLAVREHIREYLADRERAGLETGTGTWDELVKTEQVVHLSPLSEVANEIWLFWETGRMLIRFASDIDLENPAVWEHDDLAVKLYNVDEQTVVSLDEVAGSNAYMTRDQVGRALFNCVVLGRRLVLDPSHVD